MWPLYATINVVLYCNHFYSYLQISVDYTGKRLAIVLCGPMLYCYLLCCLFSYVPGARTVDTFKQKI